MSDQDPLGSDIIQDLRDGADETTLVEKYNLSQDELQDLVDELFDESFAGKSEEEAEQPLLRTIEAEEIINDIRSGMAEDALKRKYELSSGALAKAVQLLFDGSHLNRCDLARGAVPYEEVVEPGKVRRVERYYLDFELPIVATDGPEIIGKVRDLTTRGLGTVGIRASVGDVKTLRVQHERFVLLKPFSLQAQCRWIKGGQGASGLIAGFRITSISGEDKEQLRKLVRLLRFYVVSTAHAPFAGPTGSTEHNSSGQA
jgi:uncharacterized protein (DUF433 family)